MSGASVYKTLTRPITERSAYWVGYTTAAATLLLRAERLRTGLAEDLEGLLDLLVTGHQGDQDAQAMAVHPGFQDQQARGGRPPARCASAASSDAGWRGQRVASRARGQHRAEPAHVADLGSRGASSAKAGPHASPISVPRAAGRGHAISSSTASAAAQATECRRSAADRARRAASMISRLPITPEIGRPPRSTWRRDQVGLDAGVLDREHAAGAAEAGLHLVGDQHDAVLVGDLAQPAHPRGGAARRSRPRPAPARRRSPRRSGATRVVNAPRARRARLAASPPRPR